MKIIPVLDILDGIVVHAEEGRREKYKPIKSQLCKSTQPIDIAISYKSTFEFNELYIADLNSIMEKGNNYDIIYNIFKTTKMEVIVDAGTNNKQKAKELYDRGVSKIIIGTETMDRFDFINEILNLYNKKNIIISIDIKNDKILSKDRDIAKLTPVLLLRKLESMGINEVIVIDLTKVGSKNGVNMMLAENIARSTNISVVMGGGVKNIDDILLLKKLNFAGVLVSSALHNLEITKKDLQKLD